MKYLMKRLMSLLLCLSMIIAWVPAGAATVSAVQSGNRTADPATLNQWQDYFGSDDLSTEFAGGVWTDKSVMLDGTRLGVGMKDGDSNFLIALSALAANQQIMGYNTAPVDVMLVLDVSGSMEGSKATSMVQATNETLDSLLKQNNNNRVGVVLYSGNSSTSENAGTGTATVILPLDRYTTSSTQTVGSGANRKTIPAYFSISNNTVSVSSGVRNSDNQRPRGSKAVSGGTYIQNGIYKAWGEFSNVTDVKVPAGQAQAGAQRTPVMILFSDGQPTLGTTAYNNVGTSIRTYGDGQEKNTTWQTVFLSQLTAAWAKGKMAAKYGTTAKFYTIGLGTGASDYASAVLDPTNATDNTLAGYWNNFFDSTKLDGNGNVTVANNWKLAKDNAVASKHYVDLYKLAANTSDMLEAFQKIVESIELDAAGHVTLVEDEGENLSGYITFTDELGMFMEVKDMKGLMLGDTLYTGAKFAQKLGDGSYGSMETPSDLGNEFVRSVRERIGLDVSTAQTLVAAAYADGQIAYTSDSDFSNYLGWYSDDAGTYLGFWDKDTGITAEGAPAGATWINKSYLFQDAMNGSDMMHIVVLVATHIASGMQVVQYKIPASLIPKVTYEVKLKESDVTDMESLTRKDAAPLRLIYEVGLHDSITPINVSEKLQAAIDAGYGHAHKEADGSYAFYTNLWGAEHGDTTVDYTDPMNYEVAQSHFHPAVGNDRYYYTADTPIYSDDRGTAYNGSSQPSGSGYYRAHHYYTESGYTTEYVPVAPEALAVSVKKADGWYVPAGTVFQQIDRFKMHKSENSTGTLEYFDHPVVVRTGDKYDTYAFLGNNGKITLMPDQGIRLTKTLAEAVEGAENLFTFDITLSEAVADPTVTDSKGEPYSFSRSGNVITVVIPGGETLYITGLPTGVTYTVAERSHADYVGSSTNATGTVEAGKISPVDFVNVPRGYGNLIISKDVDHPFVSVPEALTQKEFSITVTLTGEYVANKQFAIAGTNDFITTDDQGSFTVSLKDNGSLTVVGLPEGTQFTTTENLDPAIHAGFTMDAQRSTLTGTIVKDQTAQTHVVNVYAPEAPQTKVQIGGSKILTDETGAFNWADKSFTVSLEQYDPASGTYTLLGQKQVTASSLSYLFADEIRFSALGTYYFKVSEVIPAERIEGMAYDATVGRIEVVVTDENVDGVMELTVYDFDTKQVIAPVSGVVTYTKNFENIYTTDSTYVEFTVDKNVLDSNNTGVSEAGFLFELYEVIGGVTQTTPAYSMRTVLVDGQGQAKFHIPVTKVGSRTFILKETQPTAADRIPGMQYDDKSYTVVVEGRANAQSKLEGVVTITDASGAVVTAPEFTNTIDLEPVELQPGVTKELIGREPLSDSEFTFTMTQTDGSFTTPIAGGYSSTVSVGKGNARFAPITLEHVGTYYFRVVEVAGNSGGMHYDASIYHITVNVTVENDTLQKTVSFVKVGLGETPTAAQTVLFTNTYANTDTEDVTIQGNKSLTGRDLITGEFSFQLKEGDQVLQTVSNRADGSFVFAPITYTAADVGEHTYTVSEMDSGKGGVTYDKTVYTVTVTVADNGKGELVVTTSGAEGISFANTYEAKPATVSFGGTKTWFNNDLGEDKAVPADQFTFVLYASDASFSTQGQQVASVSNAAGGSFGFSLSYSAVGRYYYILRERNDGDPTVGYDSAAYHISVHVYDNGLGQMIGAVDSIEQVGTGSNVITFRNGYMPLETQTVISGTKTLTGRNLADGEFSFQLIQDGNVLQTVENTGNSFAFDAIAYDYSGTYSYQVVEVIPDQAVGGVYNGVTYDATVFDVTVTVTDVNGQLTAVQTVTVNGTAAELAFENTYNITKFTDFDLSGEKWLYLGTAPISLGGRSFRFVMKDATGAVLQTVTADADGKFSFQDVPLTKTGLNTFTVEELDEGLGGIGYDTTVFTVTVDVADSGQGDLIAGVPVVTVKGEAARLRFENTYTLEPVELPLQVQKVLEGKNLAADQFSFQLFGADGTLLQTKTNAQTGEVLFDAITYTAAGTYTYTVKEVIPDGPKNGISYDGRTVNVTVKVTDNGDGTLSALAEYAGGPVFTNVYTVTGDPLFSVYGQKELTGRELVNNEFTFVLTDKNGKTLEASNTGKSFSFVNVKLPGLGVHTYTVTEKDTGKGGVEYDETVYTVTVTVTDDGHGGMNVSAPVITVQGTEQALVFTNSYSATPVEYTLTATKSYNKPLTDGLFTFTLTGEGESQRKTNVGKDITFDKLTFTQAGNYTYTVEEVNGGKSYITYDSAVYTVQFAVIDNGRGALEIESITYTRDGSSANAIAFTNTYSAKPATYMLTAQKNYSKPLTGGEFTFTLTGEGENQSKTNAAGGAITFDQLTFTEAKDYVYTVTEVKGDKSYITYDETVYTVTVQVVDNEEGQLVVQNVTVTDDRQSGNASVIFNNRYELTGNPVFSLTGSKELTGRNIVNGEFSFVLTDSQGNTVEVTNVGNTFTFTDVPLSGLGEHRFTLTEKIGADPYITYDGTVYTVTVNVVDDQVGGMHVEAPVVTRNGAAAQPTFTNTYTEPNPVDVQVVIEKTVEGDMSAEGFTFELVKDGQVLTTVAADENGKAVIDMSFTLEALGSHSFQLREVNTGEKYVTYDATVYTIDVTISEDGAGQLIAATKLNGEDAQQLLVRFVNIYDPPGTPNTGDNTNVQLLVSAMGVSALGILVLLAVLLLDKKRNPFMNQ